MTYRERDANAPDLPIGRPGWQCVRVIAACRESLTATILFAVFLAAAITFIKSGSWEASVRERARIMQSLGNRPDTDTQRRVGRLLVALVVVGLVASATALLACQV